MAKLDYSGNKSMNMSPEKGTGKYNKLETTDMLDTFDDFDLDGGMLADSKA